MKASDACIELIKRFEGFRAQMYLDAAGLETIGYGHLILVRERDEYAQRRLTEGEATALLCDDLERFEVQIEDLVEAGLTQNQFDALCCLVLNIGAGAFRKSTLLKRLNEHDFDSAAAEFHRWNKAGGRVLSGLVRRRKAEAELFEGAN